MSKYGIDHKCQSNKWKAKKHTYLHKDYMDDESYSTTEHCVSAVFG